MSLNKHLAQGKLLHYCQSPEPISVSESEQLRWIAFDDIVQSVVRKNKPHQLTLPHQWALMMPLLNFTPSTLTEFGLGAGNHLLFVESLAKNINHQVIENNSTVIELALNFFPLSKYKANIVHQDAKLWLEESLSKQEMVFSDWVIFDIYQKAKFGDSSYNQLLSKVIESLPSGVILSINFPESTEKEIMFWLGQLAAKQTHIVNYYTVPHFKNQIIHLIPKQPNNSIAEQSALSLRQQRYWRAYQLQFGLTTT